MIYPFRFSPKLVDTCRIPQKRCVIGKRFVPSSTSHGPCCGQPPGGSPFGGSETARGGALSQLSRDCWHSQYPLVISLGLQERLSPQDSQPSVFACCKAGQFSNQSTHEFDQQMKPLNLAKPDSTRTPDSVPCSNTWNWSLDPSDPEMGEPAQRTG